MSRAIGILMVLLSFMVVNLVASPIFSRTTKYDVLLTRESIKSLLPKIDVQYKKFPIFEQYHKLLMVSPEECIKILKTEGETEAVRFFSANPDFAYKVVGFFFISIEMANFGAGCEDHVIKAVLQHAKADAKFMSDAEKQEYQSMELVLSGTAPFKMWKFMSDPKTRAQSIAKELDHLLANTK